jgi:hypothetical protein
VPFDFDRFIKLMMMTTSDQDGEALTAMRKANALLAGLNRNWEELLKGKITVQVVREFKRVDPVEERHTNANKHSDAYEINSLFEMLMREVSPNSSFREFVESVHEYWENNGFITDAQYRALKKSANRRAG